MVLRGISLALATVTLMGCSVGEEVARDQARDAIDPIVAEKFPGVPVKPVTDCVIDNATFKEILTLAAASGTGNTGQVAKVVVDIVARPDTIKCIAVKGLPALLAGLG
jgi:hypothetical protein